MNHCDCGAIIQNNTQCPYCGKGHYEVNDPVRRLRRRVEDVLRKSKDEVVIKTAEFLGVK